MNDSFLSDLDEMSFDQLTRLIAEYGWTFWFNCEYEHEFDLLPPHVYYSVTNKSEGCGGRAESACMAAIMGLRYVMKRESHG